MTLEALEVQQLFLPIRIVLNTINVPVLINILDCAATHKQAAGCYHCAYTPQGSLPVSPIGRFSQTGSASLYCTNPGLSRR